MQSWGFDLDGVVVPVLEDGAYTAEVSGVSPAGPDFTGTRNAVALASNDTLRLESLKYTFSHCTD